MRSSPSLAAGDPEQLAWIAAHAGTATGLGSGLGLEAGVGVGVGVGLGLRLGEAACEGLDRVTTGPLAPQPAMAANAHMRTTPFLTAGETNMGATGLRMGIFWRERSRIPANRIVYQ
jgi:hypothetical protein